MSIPKWLERSWRKSPSPMRVIGETSRSNSRTIRRSILVSGPSFRSNPNMWIGQLATGKFCGATLLCMRRTNDETHQEIKKDRAEGPMVAEKLWDRGAGATAQSKALAARVGEESKSQHVYVGEHRKG